MTKRKGGDMRRLQREQAHAYRHLYPNVRRLSGLWCVVLESRNGAIIVQSEHNTREEAMVAFAAFDLNRPRNLPAK